MPLLILLPVLGAALILRRQLKLSDSLAILCAVSGILVGVYLVIWLCRVSLIPCGLVAGNLGSMSLPDGIPRQSHGTNGSLTNPSKVLCKKVICLKTTFCLINSVSVTKKKPSVHDMQTEGFLIENQANLFWLTWLG